MKLLLADLPILRIDGSRAYSVRYWPTGLAQPSTNGLLLGKPLSMRLDEHGGLTELSVAWRLSKTDLSTVPAQLAIDLAVAAWRTNSHLAAPLATELLQRFHTHGKQLRWNALFMAQTHHWRSSTRTYRRSPMSTING